MSDVLTAAAVAASLAAGAGGAAAAPVFVPASLPADRPTVVAQADPPASADVRDYDVPAGPLSAVLARFASESGLLMASPGHLVEHRHSAGVRGRHTAQAALAELLRGTGLTAVRNARGHYDLLLVDATTPASAASAASPTAAPGGGSLAPVTVSARAERSPMTEDTRSYSAPVVSIARDEQALKDIPQSISVLTRQRIDDQAMTSLPDAINQSTGMVGVQGVGPGMAINARGFPVDMLQYDGVPFARNVYSLGNWEQESLVFYDRVEMLRGAAGLLQGAGSPGGAINLVRKRPGATPALSMTGRIGSWDRYGLQVDGGTPLNASGSVRGRAVVDVERSHAFTDYFDDQTRNLYAALDVDATPDTTIGLGVGNRLSRSRPMIVGLPRHADGSSVDLPRSTYTGASWNRARNDQTMVFADVEHRFDARWRLKASLVSMNERNTTVHQRTSGPVEADGSGLDYGDFAVDFEGRHRGLDVALSGRYESWGLPQQIVLGANLVRYRTRDRYTRAWESGGNLFAIDHDRPWQDIDTIAARGSDRQAAYQILQKGVYGTWRVQPTRDLSLIAGGRVGWYDYAYRPDWASASTSHASGRAIPYAGVVYALDARWSAYGSYTTVFEPQTARTADNALLEPIEGRNYEAGIKGELLDRRVTAALALFRYEHRNRAVNDLAGGFACDGWYCSRASGEVRSQGIEAELSGEVVRGLQLFAGYTYNTTRYLSDPTYQGQVFNTWTPRHLLRLWAQYRLPGDASRISVGAGVNAQSATLSSDREFALAGFAIWNARVAYRPTPELELALNVSNLLDRKYFVPSYNTLSGNNYYGTPRALLLTIRYTPRIAGGRQ